MVLGHSGSHNIKNNIYQSYLVEYIKSYCRKDMKLLWISLSLDEGEHNKVVGHSGKYNTVTQKMLTIHNSYMD